jgi:hypothetical protein
MRSLSGFSWGVVQRADLQVRRVPELTTFAKATVVRRSFTRRRKLQPPRGFYTEIESDP